jgi:hypothetical protein
MLAIFRMSRFFVTKRGFRSPKETKTPVRSAKKMMKDLGVFLGLLKTLGRTLMRCLGLNDCEHQIRAVSKQIVGALLLTPSNRRTCDDDAAISKGNLFAYLVVGPTRRVEFREDILSAGIGVGTESWLFLLPRCLPIITKEILNLCS